MPEELKKEFSDDELVEAVRKGYTEDFSVLVKRYGRKIFHFVKRMTADADEAESITQEVFTNVFAHLNRYTCQGNFQAFIFRAAKNTTLNHLNRQKRTVFFSRLVKSAESFTVRDNRCQNEDPSEILARKESQDMVTAALKRLRETQRLALILKVYLDLSYKEIADITGWSTSKIETLISRAKTALKKDILLQEMPSSDVKKE